MAGCQFHRALVWGWSVICERGGQRSWTRVFSDARTARKTCDSALVAPRFLHTDSNNEVILARGMDGWVSNADDADVGLQTRQTHQERIPWGLTRGIYELSFLRENVYRTCRNVERAGATPWMGEKIATTPNTFRWERREDVHRSE